MCHFRAQNDPYLLNIFFVGTNHYYYFHLPIGRFHCAKYKKFLLRIQNHENAPFWGLIWSICPKQFFGGEITIILIYLLVPFIAQNFKKILPADPVMKMRNFWAQNGPFPQIRIFSKTLLMSLNSFIHAYLHVKNQSQILIY